MACDTEKKELDKASKALNEASEDWWQGAVAMGVGAVVVVGTVLTTPFTLGGSLVVGGTLIATYMAGENMDDKNEDYDDALKDYNDALNAYCDCIG